MMTPLLAAVMSTWTPPMAGDCVQWFKSSHGITITGSGVSAWLSLTGSNNATQGTDANRPSVNASGIGASKPTVAFTGVRFLSHSLRVQVPCTIACVAKTTQNDAINYAVVGSWSNGAGGAFVFANGASMAEWGYYANANALSGATLLAFKRCVAIARADNDIDLRTNGSSVTVATGVSAVVAASAIGAGNGVGTQNLEGEIAEVIAFSAVKSVAVAERIEAMQAIEYAL